MTTTHTQNDVSSNASTWVPSPSQLGGASNEDMLKAASNNGCPKKTRRPRGVTGMRGGDPMSGTHDEAQEDKGHHVMPQAKWGER